MRAIDIIGRQSGARAENQMPFLDAKSLRTHVTDRHALLVVMQVEAVEVDTLLAARLDDAKRLSAVNRDRFSGNRRNGQFVAACAQISFGHSHSCSCFRRISPQSVFLAVFGVPMEENCADHGLVRVAQSSAMRPDLSGFPRS